MNEITIVKNDLQHLKFSSVYLNGIFIEGITNFELNIPAQGPQKVKLEIIIDKISHTEEIPETNCIVIQGEKYRLVPYEQWIEPISDSIPF